MSLCWTYQYNQTHRWVETKMMMSGRYSLVFLFTEQRMLVQHREDFVNNVDRFRSDTNGWTSEWLPSNWQV